MKPIFVLKADRTQELFKEVKLRQSLKKAGASSSEVELIMHSIERELHDGIATEVIYRRAFELLRELPQPVAARYSLRRALFGLGPTGFPFEDYLAALYTHDGYRTKTRVVARGKCTTHELDVIAWKPGDTVIAEAKFHLQPGTKSDLQVALYSYARFLDLEAKSLHKHDDQTNKRRAAVITNTKFTSAAIEYGKCVGIELIGWDHPREHSLQSWIERTKLYPITVLSSLRAREKSTLLQSGAVLCRDIVDNEGILSSAGLTKSRIRAVLEEGTMLCAHP
jgi:hypothetical protein